MNEVNSIVLLLAAAACLLAFGCEEESAPLPPAPVKADFRALPVSGPAPLKVYFEDLSTGPEDGIDTWAWTFGDGNGAAGQNPTHSYNNPGTYTVALTVSGPGGTDTLTRTGFIVVDDPLPAGPQAHAQFSATPLTGDAPLAVQFTDLSTGSQAIDSWSWTFGDGGTSTDQDPAHTYTAAGTYAVSLSVTVSTAQDTETKTGLITVTAPAGPAPLVQGSLKSKGVPTGGLDVISDLEVFGNKLWMMEAKNPLADWGAKVYTYDATSFSQELSDATSQGYLRGRVLGGKLYVPDGDPNGYDPGIVYVWSSATSGPVSTSVTSSVHNFDVASFGGSLYTSGGLVSGSSGLSRLNGAGTTWDVASTGSYSRLKYMAVFDNHIWATKRNIGSSAELVVMDSTLTQSGVDVIANTEAMCVDLQVINGNLYMTLWGQTGVLHCYVQPTTWNIVNLTGITSDLLWDYCVHSDGNIYAVGMFGIYGSQDGTAFTKIITVSDNRFGQPGGNNADGRASIASYNGKLYVGSSTNGTLYAIE